MANNTERFIIVEKPRLISNKGSICLGGKWIKVSSEAFDGNITLVEFLLSNLESSQEKAVKQLQTAVDCQMGPWSVYSSCSASCGPGYQTRTRNITREPQHGGQPCGRLQEVIDCNYGDCPPPPPIPPARQFSSLTVQEQMACARKKVELDYCRTDPEHMRINCPHVNCGAQIAFENTVRAQNAVVCEAKKRSGDCEYDRLRMEQSCPGVCPPPINCQVSAWTDWGPCSRPCRGGTQERTRSVTTEPQWGGSRCPELTESRPCNTHRCPDEVDCVVGKWSEWSPCTNECGGGTQERTREVKVEPKNGGDACPVLRETRECNIQQCVPQDCKVSVWSDWSPCSKPCINGKQEKTRNIISREKYGGQPCPVLKEERACNRESCPLTFDAQNNPYGSESGWSPPLGGIDRDRLCCALDLFDDLYDTKALYDDSIKSNSFFSQPLSLARKHYYDVIKPAAGCHAGGNDPICGLFNKPNGNDWFNYFCKDKSGFTGWNGEYQSRAMCYDDLEHLRGVIKNKAGCEFDCRNLQQIPVKPKDLKDAAGDVGMQIWTAGKLEKLEPYCKRMVKNIKDCNKDVLEKCASTCWDVDPRNKPILDANGNIKIGPCDRKKSSLDKCKLYRTENKMKAPLNVTMWELNWKSKAGKFYFYNRENLNQKALVLEIKQSDTVSTLLVYNEICNNQNCAITIGTGVPTIGGTPDFTQMKQEVLDEVRPMVIFVSFHPEQGFLIYYKKNLLFKYPNVYKLKDRNDPQPLLISGDISYKNISLPDNLPENIWPNETCEWRRDRCEESGNLWEGVASYINKDDFNYFCPLTCQKQREYINKNTPAAR